VRGLAHDAALDLTVATARLLQHCRLAVVDLLRFAMAGFSSKHDGTRLPLPLSLSIGS
jgi:hypothetical protein